MPAGHVKYTMTGREISTLVLQNSSLSVLSSGYPEDR